MIPLLTSIPPRFSRFASSLDVSELYLAQCVASWRDNGFKPYSINTRREYEMHPLLRETLDKYQVTSIVVERDASNIASKPLPYLQDFFFYGDQLGSEEGFAITNSDIYFTEALGASLLRSLPSSVHAAYAHRYEIDDLPSLEIPDISSIYLDGFDFFYLRPPCSLHSSLVFGLPWWDYFIPVSSILQGSGKVVLLKDAICCHLRHQERWNKDSWYQMAEHLIHDLSQASNDQASDFNQNILLPALARAGSVFPSPSSNPLSYFKHSLKLLMPAYRNFVDDCKKVEFTWQMGVIALGFIRYNSDTISLPTRH